jgi:biotin carboxyl carrier protein
MAGLTSGSFDAVAGGSLHVLAQFPVIADSATKDSAAKAPSKPAPSVVTRTVDLGWTKVLCEALALGEAAAIRQRLVEGLAQRYGAAGVALCWQMPRQPRWLAVVNGTADFDRRTLLGRSLQAAAAETWLQAQPLLWPTLDGQRGIPPTYRQLAEQLDVPHMVGVPLPGAAASSPAVLLVWGDAGAINNAQFDVRRDDFLQALAGTIRLMDQATPAKWGSVAFLLSPVMHLPERPWLLLVIACLLIFAAFIPVPDRVRCDASLEPQLKRFVVAPFDGKLEKSLVRTGDEVKAGQTLATLDQRPLQMELSVLIGEQAEASKRRDAARAKGQAALSQLAELVVEQIAGKMAHLQHQLNQLSVNSPIAGVVVRGELERVEGAPIQRGNSLFEVAPLSPIIAEIAVPEDEVNLIAPGMSVSLWPASVPGNSLQGKVERVHPRAEIRDGQSVFIAEVVIENEDGRFRPGMRASAIVWSQSQPLGWTLIRRPFHRLTRWMWW